VDYAVLAHQLRMEEGERFAVYSDSRGVASVGVGHRLLPVDHLRRGDRISQAHSARYLKQDIEIAVGICLALWLTWHVYPEEVQQVLAQMAYQLGYTGFEGFRHFAGAIEHRHWQAAARHGRQSRWYRQVPQRAERLMARLEAVPPA